ncbi:NAD(P)-binding domain-containing protein [Inquilinus limosus]|uniref:NAD(P)-binding domain-containing protein n=1 Tax=Inquilinus limosus TaxID=171674 RepID=UPI003F1674BD
MPTSVAIVGAGPHGLSIAAHLRDAGLQPHVFGEVMGFWRRAMPVGMLLRSERAGSHIADPHHRLTLDQYEAEHAKRLPRRVPLDEFIAYGLWYQKRAVPEVDDRRVVQIGCESDRFRLALQDGTTVMAERVVVATGFEGYASQPSAFANVPACLAPHSSEIRDTARFAGLRVAVIGAGQSALELAALLHESGAMVEVIARCPAVRFLSGRDLLRGSPVHPLIYPPGELGPPGINWIIQLPDLFRSLPAGLQQRVARQVGPVGAAWLRSRLADVKITAGRRIVAASAVGNRLRLTLDDGSERTVDQAVLATGFRVDLDKNPVLDPRLVRSLRRLNGSPELSRGFESSIPGLYFAGAAAAATFGPLMRFVAGSGYAARSITRHIVVSSATARRLSCWSNDCPRGLR